MARDYGRICTRFWSSPDIRGLSDRARLLASYLLSSPHSNSIGAYLLPDAYVADDMGWSSEAVSKAFTELFDRGFAERFRDGRHICIVRFLDFNPIENPNVGKAAIKAIEQLPDDPAMRHVFKGLEQYGKHFGDSLETVREQFRNIEPNLTEPNQSLPAGAGREGIRTNLTEGFEEFHSAYQPPKNSKKPDAIKAWISTAKTRPPLPELLRAVAAYNSWLAEESRKQKRDYPKQHAATWLRGEVWNGYLTPAMDPEVIAAAMDRADKILRRGKYDPQKQAMQ
jgi:hypothetical protein